MKTLEQPAFDNVMATMRHNRHGINSIAAWDVAKQLGIDYDGDCNLEHGGTFYDASDWTAYGYANAVRVDVVDDCVMIDCGQIHRSQVDDALRCCGWRFNDDGDIETEDGDIVADTPESIVRVEISACESYAGIESDNCRMCPLTIHYTGDLDDCFRDGSATIKLSDLQGYVVRRYVLGNVVTID